MAKTSSKKTAVPTPPGEDQTKTVKAPKANPALAKLEPQSEVNYVLTSIDKEVHNLHGQPICRAFVKQISGDSATLYIKTYGKGKEDHIDLGAASYSENQEPGTFHLIPKK
jgi:hypothetical protein